MLHNKQTNKKFVFKRRSSCARALTNEQVIHHMILIEPDRGRSIRKITFLHTEYENVQNLNMNIEENHD
jgi:hypothetical protein